MAMRSLIESHEGWEVCGEAEDGDEAVPKAAALNPDAIILDLVMPRMDGLEAARHILKASPSVPIILHTSHRPLRIPCHLDFSGWCSQGSVNAMMSPAFFRNSSVFPVWKSEFEMGVGEKKCRRPVGVDAWATFRVRDI